MCMYCRCKTTRQAPATYVANCKGSIIIVKNVPSEECELCGEKYYSNEVALRLEAIVSSVKVATLDTAIVEYTPAS